ncbi:MAG: Zinc-type alcohol dehydrogenase-like protein [Schlesneria sp.]|nr:Zinc-type alcohol dehydrogenase-like protein [Schlesneria sp.]
MRAVTFNEPLPISHENSLIDVTVERPTLRPRDLLVEVRAISVNPVDTKIRGGGGPKRAEGGGTILGWDAAGVVAEVGPEVTDFNVGDEVYYAGSINRSGSYAEYQAVDARIVGRKPQSIGFAEAAALPLATITAWELMFDRMNVRRGGSSCGAMLIIGGAGGVGSIATQLARQLTGLTVITTASRPETVAWSQEMGAHHVIDHRQPIAAQVKSIAPAGVKYVLSLTRTEDYIDDILEVMQPQGVLGLIENVARPLDINRLKPKCLSLHWEFMFARALFETDDMAEQGKLLNEVAVLVDAGRIRSTCKTNLGLINAANLKQAHSLVESGRAVGKVVLAGF